MAKYMKTEDGYQKIEVINANKMNMNNPVGTGSFSMGRKAGTTVGPNSHAEGSNTIAPGPNSHAEGSRTTASGPNSHAEGSRTTASGSDSHAEGSNTIASGSDSHAEGSRTTASGSDSHAEGSNTIASGWYSHAEGSDTTASNLNSHAEGSNTTASGYASHAEGVGTTASGYTSHAEGVDTVASTLNQHVSGSCNILDPSLEGPEFRGRYIHIVGNGLNKNSRSNAHTLDWSGNAWFAGDVYVGSTSGTNKDDGSKKLATEDYVNNNVDATLTQPGQAADAAAVGEQLSSLSEEIDTTSESKVSAHNTGTDTHSDIRLLIQGLTDRLNALADSDDTTLDQLSEVVAYIKSNRGLIEAITTSKVSVADIVDNLTTNIANKPLSAAQGVALKALIDAITVPDKLPNPNALTFTGAVTGSYDGSEPLTVEIPSGGGGSEGTSGQWEYIGEFTEANQPTFESSKYRFFYAEAFYTKESSIQNVYDFICIDGYGYNRWALTNKTNQRGRFLIAHGLCAISHIEGGTTYPGGTSRGSTTLHPAFSKAESVGTAFWTASGSDYPISTFGIKLWGAK